MRRISGAASGGHRWRASAAARQRVAEGAEGIRLFVQVETNGSLPVPPEVDWVTCSPKEPPYAIDRVDELKIVFQNQDVESVAGLFETPRRFLQPCSGSNVEETIAYILEHPHWRLSLQTHRFIGIR